MDNDFEVAPDPQVDQSLKETLTRAQSFELLMGAEAWKYIHAFVENHIKSFANRAIKEGFKDFEEYQFERGKVFGLNSLVSDIENDLRILNEQRAKSAKSAK